MTVPPQDVIKMLTNESGRMSVMTASRGKAANRHKEHRKQLQRLHTLQDLITAEFADDDSQVDPTLTGEEDDSKGSREMSLLSEKRGRSWGSLNQVKA